MYNHHFALYGCDVGFTFCSVKSDSGLHYLPLQKYSIFINYNKSFQNSFLLNIISNTDFGINFFLSYLYNSEITIAYFILMKISYCLTALFYNDCFI